MTIKRATFRATHQLNIFSLYFNTNNEYLRKICFKHWQGYLRSQLSNHGSKIYSASTLHLQSAFCLGSDLPYRFFFQFKNKLIQAANL